MSGHSKWSQIKHKKGIADAKKGQLFSKLGKLISIAAKNGADPAGNVALQGAIERARSFNMPKENIERAIKRASDKSALILEEISVKGLTTDGIGLTVEAITDNKNRTIAEIKMIFAKHNAKMVAWVPDYPMEVADSAKDALMSLIEELDENEDVKDIHTNAHLGD